MSTGQLQRVDTRYESNSFDATFPNRMLATSLRPIASCHNLQSIVLHSGAIDTSNAVACGGRPSAAAPTTQQLTGAIQTHLSDVKTKIVSSKAPWAFKAAVTLPMPMHTFNW